MARLDRASRCWILSWPGGIVIGVGNGVVREATYGKRLGEGAAHQVSSAAAILAFAGYFWALGRRWPLPDDAAAYRVGGVWLTLTVIFEFAFGRTVAKLSWEELLRDYDVSRGRTWPLVLLWIAIGPDVVRRTQA